MDLMLYVVTANKKKKSISYFNHTTDENGGFPRRNWEIIEFVFSKHDFAYIRLHNTLL